MARDITFFPTAAAEAGNSAGFVWDGGRGNFEAVGTADGVSLEKLARDGTNWIAVGDDTTLSTLPGHGNFDLPPCQLRATVTGETVSGVEAWAIKIGDA